MTYLQAITIIHTAISMAAILAGAVATVGLFRGGAFRQATRVFLVLALATSITGFFFPFKGVTPAVVTGIVALVVLAGVLIAFYRFRLARAWRWIYAAGMVISLYLLVFVGVVQAFQKLAPLHRLAPTQTETPFLVAQLATLAFFAIVGLLAALRFRPEVVEARFGTTADQPGRAG